MHKITSKEINLNDFSYENFIVDGDGHYYEVSFEDFLEPIVIDCEWLRKKYLETKDKKYWNALIWLLPQSYNQKRTVTMNYEVLYQMYHQRNNHKLKEWHDFCDVIKTLPYAMELIVGEEEKPPVEKQPVTAETKKAEEPATDKAETCYITISDGFKTISEWDSPIERFNAVDNCAVPIRDFMVNGNIYAFDRDGNIGGCNLYESKDPMVSHPKHYKGKHGMEVIDVIEDFTEGLEGVEATDTGNIIKYACRWSKKGNAEQDVEKIIWYATHLLNYLKEKRKSGEKLWF
jgi:hypothetical protein